MTKIEALEKTIYNLENDVYEYLWTNPNSCNCGVLAHTIVGELPSRTGYFDANSGLTGSFSRRAKYMNTGLPMPLVFQSLKDTGFTHQELEELEFLGNPKIAERCGFKPEYHGEVMIAHGHFSKKPSVISYLKAWVEILKEEEVKIEVKPEIKEIIRYVAVSETIKEMEVIEN